MKNNKLKYNIVILFFITIEIVLAITPLGFINIGPIRSTTLHIPVILAGLLLGYKASIYLGITFGITSVFINTIMPTVASFIFSPFVSVGNYQGNIYSLVIAIIPRILLGLITVYIYKKFNKDYLAISISTIMHTVIVMGMIFLFFNDPYASINNISSDLLFKFIMGVIATNGVMEVIVANAIVIPMYNILKKEVRRFSL